MSKSEVKKMVERFLDKDLTLRKLYKNQDFLRNF
jgi:hypothetical protein